MKKMCGKCGPMYAESMANTNSIKKREQEGYQMRDSNKHLDRRGKRI
jgi:hypothetical protein